MQNDYTNKPTQATTDKSSEFAKSTSQQGEQKGNDVVGDAQRMLKEGQQQAGKVVDTLDKQVRENPWLIIAGVAIGAFVLGSVLNRSNK